MGWDGKTLEQALGEAFENGNESSLVALLQLLPFEKRAKYRELWKSLSKKRAEKSKEMTCKHGIGLGFRCWDCDPKEGER